MTSCAAHITDPAGKNGGCSVGVFDSGIGGLSVLRAIRCALPSANLMYVADSGYAPYGQLSSKQIRQRALHITQFLFRRGSAAVVVACNTATAVAVDSLRNHFRQPIVGMEPALKPALQRTRTGRIGILATEVTLQSPRFHHLLSRWKHRAEVLLQPCPELVEEVERCNLNGTGLRSLLSTSVGPLLNSGIDTLVLGCTHYYFLHSLLRELAGPEVEILEASQPVAKQLERVLPVDTETTGVKEKASEKFWTSGSLPYFRRQLELLWEPNPWADALPEPAPENTSR